MLIQRTRVVLDAEFERATEQTRARGRRAAAAGQRRACASVPHRVQPPFAATAGALSGSVKLTVRSAGRRASYEWQSSIDGGKTWVDATPSLQAKTTIAGLPVGSTVQVRFRAIIKGGPDNWSQPLSIFVK